MALALTFCHLFLLFVCRSRVEAFREFSPTDFHANDADVLSATAPIMYDLSDDKTDVVSWTSLAPVVDHLV